LERLGRNTIFRRRLPERYESREIYVSPDAQLKYLKPGQRAFDSELLRIVDQHVHESSVVWDIGANVGVFAFAASSVARSGMTLAVEPDVWLASLMRRSLRLPSNHHLPLTVLPAAVSDRNGIATFAIAQRGRASNALESVGGRTQAGGIRERLTVPTLTLDTLLNFGAPPTFLKVDVEGAETLVLRGAEQVLRKARPIIYIEVGSEHSEEVGALLRDHQYVLFDGATYTHDSAQPLDRCVFNTLAVPSGTWSPR
jgi:FkbM family methyltransferase